MKALRYILYGAFVLLAINLVILDSLIVLRVGAFPGGGLSSENGEGAPSVSLPSASVIETMPTAGTSANLSCPVSCLSQIYTATASLKLITPTQNSIVAPTVAPTQKPTPIGILSQVTEFFIPFGNGSISSQDWTNVDGAASYIDSTRYNKIKQISFEVSAHIPTGNEIAYIRLFDSTDQHPVWYSDVSLQGGTTQLLISQAISLDSGNKLYQVQAKTSLAYQVVIDQARLHIITQ